MTRRTAALIAFTLMGCIFSKHSLAADLKVTESTFAVCTHKGGIGAKLAHNHMIVADHSDVQVAFDPKDPSKAKFAFETKAAELEVDDDAMKAGLWAHIQGRGIYPELPPAVPPDTRAKIQATMLSKDVLWASKYPTIKASVVGLGTGADKVDITIRGVTKSYAFKPKWDFTAGILTAEALIPVKGTDFGIEPYSAALGAIKNEDDMQIFVNFKAK